MPLIGLMYRPDVTLPLSPAARRRAALRTAVAIEGMVWRVGPFTPFEQTKTAAHTVAVLHAARLCSKL